MALVVARKTQKLSESTDFKADVLQELGSLEDVDVYFNHVLVATYIGGEKIGASKLLYRPQSSVQEDTYQGKVGVVIKKGPNAFQSDEEIDFGSQTVEPGDYVVYRTGDGWDITINGVACRMLADRNIKMRVKDPEVIF